MNWITELGWAIELIVMHARWLTDKEIDYVLPDDEQYYRVTWVRMCMRLGDHVAHRIAGTQERAVFEWEGKPL